MVRVPYGREVRNQTPMGVDMSLLTAQEIYEIAATGNEGRCFGDLAWQECTEGFAKALQAVFLKKLASAELPEPLKCFSYPKGKCQDLYSGDQLRQAFAQGAASQLAEKPSAWIDGSGFVVSDTEKNVQPITFCMYATPLFTLKEPK